MKEKLIKFMVGDSSLPFWKRLIIGMYSSKGVYNLVLNVSTLWWIIASRDAAGYNSIVSAAYIILPVLGMLYNKVILNDTRWIMGFRQLFFNVILFILTLIF